MEFELTDEQVKGIAQKHDRLNTSIPWLVLSGCQELLKDTAHEAQKELVKYGEERCKEHKQWLGDLGYVYFLHRHCPQCYEALIKHFELEGK